MSPTEGSLRRAEMSPARVMHLFNYEGILPSDTPFGSPSGLSKNRSSHVALGGLLFLGISACIRKNGSIEPFFYNLSGTV
jgi:hypothetical protein